MVDKSFEVGDKHLYRLKTPLNWTIFINKLLITTSCCFQAIKAVFHFDFVKAIIVKFHLARQMFAECEPSDSFRTTGTLHETLPFPWLMMPIKRFY